MPRERPMLMLFSQSVNLKCVTQAPLVQYQSRLLDAPFVHFSYSLDFPHVDTTRCSFNRILKTLFCAKLFYSQKWRGFRISLPPVACHVEIYCIRLPVLHIFSVVNALCFALKSLLGVLKFRDENHMFYLCCTCLLLTHFLEILFQLTDLIYFCAFYHNGHPFQGIELCSFLVEKLYSDFQTVKMLQQCKQFDVIIYKGMTIWRAYYKDVLDKFSEYLKEKVNNFAGDSVDLSSSALSL